MIRHISLVILPLLSGCSVGHTNWPEWRGAERTGATDEKAVVTSWSQDGDNLLWKAPIGGRTTPILMDGRLYLIGPVGKAEHLQERVVCLDADSGRMLWEHRFNVFLTTIVEDRVGWTSLVGDPETGYVYAHGTGGMFYCFDRDGNVIWRRSLTEMYNRVSGYGGRVQSPIIDEDKVIISFISANWGDHRVPGHRYLAMDKKTGDVIWWAKPGVKHLDATYSIPAVAVINGVRQLIGANGDGHIYGMKARTGEMLWDFKLSKRGINSSVVVDGNYVYASHSEENYTTSEMGSVLCIDASLTGDITERGLVWRKDGITAGYASPAIANGRLYVADNAANLYCMDARSGRQLWEYRMGRVTKGSPTITADGVIYVGTVNGRFLILKDAGDHCEELDVESFSVPSGAIVEIYGSPIVADGRVYFMTRYDTYCLGRAGGRAVVAGRSRTGQGAAEAEPDPTKPATVLVVPGEVTLSPGEKVQFTTRLFDVNGRRIDSRPAKWSVGGVQGTIEQGEGGDGDFAAGGEQQFSAGVVQAMVGDLKGTARVRVSPTMPIKADFDDMAVGKTPPGWVGVGGKSQLVTVDGNIALQKLAEQPSVPFMRMYAYSGPPIAGGYTMQCDLMGKAKEGRRKTRPDMGLINSRYELIFLGKERALRIVSWSPIPRLQKEVPFDWKTDVWYQTKFRVDIRDGQGLIRAKAWPRGETEPRDWQVEVVDPCPNTEGSPGLYGYSKGTTARKHGAPTFYDNYQVYAND
jgi:outer membrane protein assembly factor BamB